MALRQIIGDLSVTLASMARTRLELFSLEAAEQRTRALQLLALAFGALVLVLIGVVVLSVAVALLFWPTEYRYVALFVIALFYLLVGIGLMLVLRYRLRFDPPPFQATLDELRRDTVMLQRLKQPRKEPGNEAGEQE